jgi:hypothetical protein
MRISICNVGSNQTIYSVIIPPLASLLSATYAALMASHASAPGVQAYGCFALGALAISVPEAAIGLWNTGEHAVGSDATF